MNNNKLNYQQARRIRKQGLFSTLADQLILGEGYGSAISKSISLTTQAKVKGIKEKFDPLNIAKFLTGGSRLGPAILGKLTGRSREDIENYTGRARAVKRGNKKIGALPGGGEDTTGMSEVLGDILSQLQKSHEDDIVLREKENNLRESQSHEEERRHKDLLKALGVKVVDAPTATIVKKDKKEEPESTASIIEKIIGNIAKTISSMIAPIVTGIGSLLALLMRIPFGIGKFIKLGIAAAGLAWFLNANNANAAETETNNTVTGGQTPTSPTNTTNTDTPVIPNEASDESLVDQGRRLVGENAGKAAIVPAAVAARTAIKVMGTEGLAAKTGTAILDARTMSVGQLAKTNPTTIWGKFLRFVAEKSPKLFGRVGVKLAQAGALATIPLVGWVGALINLGFAAWTAYEIYELWKEFSKSKEEEVTTNVPTTSTTPIVEGAGGAAFGMYSKPGMKPKTPEPVTAPPSAAVATKSAENEQNRLRALHEGWKRTTTQNKTVVNKTSNSNKVTEREPIMAVRNTEMTFKMAIYNSTRIV
jgi:hypothetical protein